MRVALVGVVALGALLLLPAAAMAATPRLTITIGYPTPGAQVVVYQQPDCEVHALLWEGAWFTIADAANWAWDGSDPAALDQLDQRLRDASGRLLALTVRAGEGAAEGWESWWEDPGLAVSWAIAVAGDEDLCVLGLVDVTTGVGR